MWSGGTYARHILPLNANTNKRAQRALGRSPEEKVKGKRSQWSHLQETTNIVYQILVEDL